MSDRELPGAHAGGSNGARRGLGCLGIAIMIVLIVGGCTVLTSVLKKPYDPNNSSEVISQCQESVRNKLKSPSTAAFSSTNATGSGTWTVSGKVDSQNSFGATVRSSFECSVTVTDSEHITTRVTKLE